MDFQKHMFYLSKTLFFEDVRAPESKKIGDWSDAKHELILGGFLGHFLVTFELILSSFWETFF